jgi:5-methylcytosine-specific restriction endonuclease McrA
VSSFIKKIICCGCGGSVLAVTNNQKRCAPCGAEADRVQQRISRKRWRKKARNMGGRCPRCLTPTESPGTCQKCKEYVKSWKAAHPSAIREASKRQREKDKALGRAWTRPRKVPSPEAVAQKLALTKLRRSERKRRKRASRRARLKQVGGRLSSGLSFKLLESQHGKCNQCQIDLNGNFHMDHIVPIALGGPNMDWNIQLLCPPCNIRKGARLQWTATDCNALERTAMDKKCFAA